MPHQVIILEIKNDLGTILVELPNHGSVKHGAIQLKQKAIIQLILSKIKPEL